MKNIKFCNTLRDIKLLFWAVYVFFFTTIIAYAQTGSGILPDFKPTGNLDEGKRTTLVVEMIKYVINDFTITAAFYDVMCWLCLFITAALGIKQLFVKSDEDRGGGFWNVLKVAGWGIAGLLGIIVKNTIKSQYINN